MASLSGFDDVMPMGAAPFISNVAQHQMQPEAFTLPQPAPPAQAQAQEGEIRARIASTMPATQQLPALPTAVQAAAPAPVYEVRHSSYVDRLWAGRRDVFKMLILVLMVTVALGINGVAKFLIKHYLSNHELTFNGQLMLRSAYPLIVLFFLWNLKISMSK